MLYIKRGEQHDLLLSNQVLPLFVSGQRPHHHLPGLRQKKHPPCHARGTHRLFSPAHRGARPRPSFRVSTAKDLPNNTGRSFTCRFHLSYSLRLLWGSARRRNVITLLGSATCLAGHRLDVVCAQVQRTYCNQIVEVTLHHCFVTLLYVIFTRPFPDLCYYHTRSDV